MSDENIEWVGYSRFQSLRCLYASIASLEVMDHLLKSRRMHHLVSDGDEIEDVLLNIRTFFLAGLFSRQEMQHRFMPLGGSVQAHIYCVLFSDAVRWWAAAHRTGRDKNKHLSASMYGVDWASHFNHFYHEFRNEQLAHYRPSGKTDDAPGLTPRPYGFFLSQQEHDDFRSLLAYSLHLTLAGEDLRTWEEVMTSLPVYHQLTEVQKQAVRQATSEVMKRQYEALLKMPTRNPFPDAETISQMERSSNDTENKSD